MKTRRYKVTMYIDVPLTSDSIIKDEDSMIEYLSEKFKADGIYGSFDVDKQPLPLELSDEIYGTFESIESFRAPVGFIAPDGLFYGMEYGTESLTHITLANEVYEYYEKIYPPERHSTIGTDVTLELMGFIKISDCTLRYYCEYGHPVYWTEAQKKTVFAWMRHMEEIWKDYSKPCLFDGIGTNGGRFWSSEFAQMDDFAIIRMFM